LLIVIWIRIQGERESTMTDNHARTLGRFAAVASN
jgi:hypothetical protein